MDKRADYPTVDAIQLHASPIAYPAATAESADGVLSGRRGFFRSIGRGFAWIAAAPVAWSGVSRIGRGGALIGNLWGLLRRGPAPDRRFKIEEDGLFDLRATAFSYGLSPAQLEARLQRRRRQTARLAYVSFVLAVLFLLAWLERALSSPLSATRVVAALYFLPFCALFFLTAFYNALLNYQIRIGRLVGWRAYLMTSDSFWPS